MYSIGKGSSDIFFPFLKKKHVADAFDAGEIDVEALFETLEKKVDQSSTIPKCIPSKVRCLTMLPGLGVFWYDASQCSWFGCILVYSNEPKTL